MENVKTCFAFFSYAPNCNLKQVSTTSYNTTTAVFIAFYTEYDQFSCFLFCFLLNFLEDVITWVLAEEDGRILKHDMTMINK